jgi:hypothetical protein
VRKRHTLGRHDLVISMTLAEIFLLLLIVGWYGSRLESEEAGREPISPAQVLEQELKDARLELDRARQDHRDLERRNKELEGILDWLGARLGSPAPVRDRSAAAVAMSTYADTVKRGKATCDSDNVLVHVVSDNGTVTLGVRKDLSAGGVAFRSGQTISGTAEIEAFLDAVRRFYAERRAGDRDCAFDFTMAWRTDRDFRVAKKTFEPYFYPAGDRQLQ